MEPLSIPIIFGASRPDSRSRPVAELVLKISKEFAEITTQLVSVSDFDVPYDEEKSIPEFYELVSNAHALFLVFPEYNHFIPGKLKSLMDTEYAIYKHLPIATASVSSGPIGGARAVENSLPFFVALKLITTGINVRFPNIKTLVDENGQLSDPAYIDSVRSAFKELIYLAKVIKLGKSAVHA